MRIYLIGYSFAGKTTIGRQLAQLLNFQFYDTDKALELKYHSTVPLLFQNYGEQAFRILERKILESTTELDNTVIATGGGASCSQPNIDFILHNGVSIHFAMTIDEIMHRMEHSRKVRPLLLNKTIDEKRLYIAHQMQHRLPFYQQANITVRAVEATPEYLRDKLEKYTSTAFPMPDSASNQEKGVE